MWKQLLIFALAGGIAQFVCEFVAVWSTTGDALAFFTKGLRLAKWKPYLRLSNGEFVVWPVDLFVFFPLWVTLSFATIAVIGRVRRSE